MDDLTSLEQSITGTDSVSTLIAWLIIPSVIIMIVLTIALFVGATRRWRMERAVFEIRDMLREMKAHQKSIFNTVPLPPANKEDTTSINNISTTQKPSS